MGCDELAKFRRNCSHEIRDITAMLETTTKAMHVRYIGKSFWGIGHMMPALYEAHQLCINHRRRCFVSIYGSGLERFFGYHNGMTWNAKDMPTYRSRRDMYVRTLSKMPRKLDDDLVVVTVQTLLYSSSIWLPTLKWDPGTTMGVSKCVCRFVTEPLVPIALPEPRVVYHLRSGYADTSFVKHASNATLGASLLAMACHSLESATVVTDSPMIQRLTSNASDLVAAGQREFRVDSRLYADILSCSRASILYTQRVSSFARPIVARSFCGTTVEDVDASPLCPRFTQMFPRDIFIKLRRFAPTQTAMPMWHPCKNVSAHQCGALLDAGLS